jgi:oligopeptide/dipeptide ABC transporter ATP-binding protein
VFTIGDQIVETMRTHLKISRSQARRRAIDLLGELEFPEADKRFDRYPHELSGGMKQRVAIAIALCCEPDLLIADEPTTALDVTTERTILNLIHRIQEERNLALLLVTHNLAVAATVADRLCVMYAGRIVEERDVKDALNSPAHPYTEALVACAESIEASTGARLATIQGTPPLLNTNRDLCTFVDRCPYSDERCRAHKPELTSVEGGRAACYNIDRERVATW